MGVDRDLCWRCICAYAPLQKFGEILRRSAQNRTPRCAGRKICKVSIHGSVLFLHPRTSVRAFSTLPWECKRFLFIMCVHARVHVCLSSNLSRCLTQKKLSTRSSRCMVQQQPCVHVQILRAVLYVYKPCILFSSCSHWTDTFETHFRDGNSRIDGQQPDTWHSKVFAKALLCSLALLLVDKSEQTLENSKAGKCGYTNNIHIQTYLQ